MVTPSNIRHSLAPRAIFVATIAIATIVLFPTIFWPFDYDQGTFAYGGWAILHGLRPYIDFWDIKPPNIFYTYATAFALFGNSVRAIRIFDYLNALLSIALLFVLTVRLWKDSTWSHIAAIFTSVAFILQYYIFGSWNTAQTETYSIPLLLGAMLLAIPKKREQVFYSRTALRVFLAGILVGISFYFKYPNAIFLILVGASIWLCSRQERLKASLWLVAGFCVAVGLESLFLALNGEFVPLWKLTTSETASYVSTSYSGSFTVLRNFRTSMQALDSLWIIAATAGWIFWARRRRNSEQPSLRPPALASLGCLLAFIVIQAENKGYTYHYGVLLPWANLLVGGGIASLSLALARIVRNSPVINSIALGMVLLLGSFFWSSRKPFQANTSELIRVARGMERPNGYIAGDSISEYVLRHTRSNDRIFIFGFQPYVYWETGRAPASKFINTIHFKSTPVPPQEREELVHDLIGNPPALFLVETQDRYTSQGNSDDDSRTTVHLHYPELEQLLDLDYRPEDTIDGTIIYRRDGFAR